jgi:hypothetical protein
MTITFEKAIQKSMTRPSLFEHHASFLWAIAPGVGSFHPLFCDS